MSNHSDSIDALIDRRPLSALQIRLCVLVSAAVLLEGFDIQLIAFAAPSILAEWGLTKAALGPVMAAALIGMAGGAAVGGALGDRWGRRTVLIASLGFFGITTFAIAFTTAAGQAATLRLLAGLGFGAALPSAAALLAEWMPPRLRSRTVMLMIVGIPLGGMLGAALTSWLIPAFGWRVAFMVGGCLPLALCGLMVIGVPESLKFLVHRGRDWATIARLLTALTGDPRFHANDVRALHVSDAPPAQSAHWRELMSAQHRRVTLGLWLAFFGNLAISHAMFSWIPTMLSSIGYATDVAIRGSLYFNLFGVISTLCVSWVMVRTGSRTPMLALVIVGFGAMIALGFLVAHRDAASSAPGALAVMIGLSVVGFANVGLQAALYAVAALVYPTSCRTSGVGWASAVGRGGALVSAFGGGAVLALPAGPAAFLGILSGLVVVAGLGVLTLNRHTH